MTRSGLPSALLTSLAFLCSCSPGNGDNRRVIPSSGDSGSGTGNPDGSVLVTGGDSGVGDAGFQACESLSTGADVDTAYLAFAFDVSGSMGKGDEAWHDRTLKWDPVVKATKAFFEDPASQGFAASLTFFPEGGGDEDVRCVDSNYVVPDVAMTPLPSTSFGVALDLMGAQSWRGGTPTLHVMNGVVQFIGQHRQTDPGNYAIVLVTDGYPQDCSDNNISSVCTVASTAAANGIPTYVIGVKNPPISGAPDTVTNLGQIAVAGGTSQAFIIDTGDPAQTIANFRSVVDQIRNASVSCTITIPPPPDPARPFDKQKVRVTYGSGATTTALVYDPSCANPNGWHYDNPDSPTQIVLCENTCGTIQADVTASLSVEFACVNVIEVL